MRHVLEASTDGGSVVLWDPGALPDGFDVGYAADDSACVDAVFSVPTAYAFPDTGDGSFFLHLWIDEVIADDYERELVDIASLEGITDPEFLNVPTGRLHYGGIEYIFRDRNPDSEGHMGASCTVEPGTYRLAAYQTGYSRLEIRRMVSEAMPPLSGSFLMILLSGIFKWADRRSREYRRTMDEYERKYPTFVVSLTRVGDAEPVRVPGSP